ncbi:MAG: hypothetical protein LPK04_00115 [Caulobacteraceae bacterium]|nr:hypothetical protein [Caulobacteraceae bacterium]
MTIEPPPFPTWRLLRGLLLSILMVGLLMGSCVAGCQGRAFEYGERCRDHGGVRSRLDCHMPRLTVIPPDAWVFRTTADLMPVYGDDPPWRKALDHYQRLAVRADFDGDGREDQAAILLDEAYERFAVYAFPAGRDPVMLASGRPVTALPGRSLAVGEAEGDRPPTLVLRAADGADENYAWDGAAFVKTAG